MARWTEERKKKQAEAIKLWKPWEKSTGPKTKDGKERCALNACKHGLFSRDSAVAIEMIRLNKRFLQLAILYASQDSAVQHAVWRKRTIKNSLKSRAGAPPLIDMNEQTIE